MFLHVQTLITNFPFFGKEFLPYLGLYNVHWCIMRTPSWPLKISRKKLVRVYNAHGLLKKSRSEM